MKKRRHHYVWQHYLESWADVDDGQIYCLREGKIFKTNPINVAVKGDFYRLKEFSVDDISHLKEIIKRCPDFLQQEYNNLIVLFDILFKFKRKAEIDGTLDTELESILDVQINNFEENIHTSVENSGMKYLHMLLNKDLSFYGSKPDAILFIKYLCLQYMRTEKRRVNSIKATSWQNVIDTNKIWNILTHIFSANMAWSILNDINEFTLLVFDNKTDNPFITGDQPVINTHGTVTALTEQVHELEFYYPLSPSKAMVLTKTPEKHLQVTAEIVDMHNHRIVLGSHQQLFSCSEESLIRLL
ncbi:MAG: DUF4238 domain-containing protein [Geobacteraceae bacterium]